MTTQLEYAPPQKWHQRRRFRRALLSLIILAALGLAAILVGPTIYNQCRMLYWQRQCMNCPPLPPTTGISSAPPPEFEKFREFISDPRLPQAGPTALWEPYAYLHARTSPAGTKLICATYVTRLVGTKTDIPILSNMPPLEFQKSLAVCVIEPGTFFSPPKFLSRNEFVLDKPGHQLSDPRIDSDPADESRIILTLTAKELSTSVKTTEIYPIQITSTGEARADRQPFELPP